MEMSWPNIVGWVGTILFVASLGAYIRYRTQKEWDERDSDQ